MTRSGRVVVQARLGPTGTFLSRLDSSGLIAARATPWGVFLVSAGASPLGGDELATEIHVGTDANLVVRSVGATLARRGPQAQSGSSATVLAVLEDRAHLTLMPEPGIAGEGANHRSSLNVDVAPSARLYVRDEVILGRSGERPGTWWSDRAISVGGRPLLVSEIGLGPDAPLWAMPNVLGGARAQSSLVLVHRELTGVSAETAECNGAVGARLPLAGPGVEISAFGCSLEACRVVVAKLAERVLDLWPFGDPDSERHGSRRHAS
jgi:urease accessory protein